MRLEPQWGRVHLGCRLSRSTRSRRLPPPIITHKSRQHQRKNNQSVVRQKAHSSALRLKSSLLLGKQRERPTGPNSKDHTAQAKHKTEHDQHGQRNECADDRVSKDITSHELRPLQSAAAAQNTTAVD